ncbi:MAG: anti-sigma factor [Planktomarina sp.]
MTEELDNNTARSGEYSLGMMTPKEATAFERDLSKDVELRAIYEDWAEGLVGLDNAGEAPSNAVKARIDKKLFPKKRRNYFDFLVTKILPLATAAFVGVTVYNYSNLPTYDVQAVASVDTITFDVRLDVETRMLVMASQAETLPDDRDHELWLIPEGGAPISLGVMENRKTVPIGGDFDFAGALIAVTIEQAGGSPTGQPTTTPIAAVPLTAL